MPTFAVKFPKTARNFLPKLRQLLAKSIYFIINLVSQLDAHRLRD